jgi:hypothetical protein
MGCAIERQAMLLAVTSDLIRASAPGELGRKTFNHVSGALDRVETNAAQGCRSAPSASYRL